MSSARPLEACGLLIPCTKHIRDPDLPSASMVTNVMKARLRTMLESSNMQLSELADECDHWNTYVCWFLRLKWLALENRSDAEAIIQDPTRFSELREESLGDLVEKMADSSDSPPARENLTWVVEQVTTTLLVELEDCTTAYAALVDLSILQIIDGTGVDSVIKERETETVRYVSTMLPTLDPSDSLIALVALGLIVHIPLLGASNSLPWEGVAKLATWVVAKTDRLSAAPIATALPATSLVSESISSKTILPPLPMRIWGEDVCKVPTDRPSPRLREAQAAYWGNLATWFNEPAKEYHKANKALRRAQKKQKRAEKKLKSPSKANSSSEEGGNEATLTVMDTPKSSRRSRRSSAVRTVSSEEVAQAMSAVASSTQRVRAALDSHCFATLSVDEKEATTFVHQAVWVMFHADSKIDAQPFILGHCEEAVVNGLGERPLQATVARTASLLNGHQLALFKGCPREERASALKGNLLGHPLLAARHFNLDRLIHHLRNGKLTVTELQRHPETINLAVGRRGGTLLHELVDLYLIATETADKDHYVELIKHVLKGGGNANLCDRDGKSPYELALLSHDDSLIDIFQQYALALLSTGARLLSAIEKSDLEDVKYTIEMLRGSPDVTDPDMGQLALAAAIKKAAQSKGEFIEVALYLARRATKLSRVDTAMAIAKTQIDEAQFKRLQETIQARKNKLKTAPKESTTSNPQPSSGSARVQRSTDPIPVKPSSGPVASLERKGSHSGRLRGRRDREPKPSPLAKGAAGGDSTGPAIDRLDLAGSGALLTQQPDSSPSTPLGTRPTTGRKEGGKHRDRSHSGIVTPAHDSTVRAPITARGSRPEKEHLLMKALSARGGASARGGGADMTLLGERAQSSLFRKARLGNRGGALNTLSRLDHLSPEEVIDLPDETGETPAVYALIGEHDIFVSLCLDMKIDLNRTSRFGWTLLHWAALRARFTGDQSLYAKLLNLGAKPTRDIYGTSPQELLEGSSSMPLSVPAPQIEDLVREGNYALLAHLILRGVSPSDLDRMNALHGAAEFGQTLVGMVMIFFKCDMLRLRDIGRVGMHVWKLAPPTMAAVAHRHHATFDVWKPWEEKAMKVLVEFDTKRKMVSETDRLSQMINQLDWEQLEGTFRDDELSRRLTAYRTTAYGEPTLLQIATEELLKRAHVNGTKRLTLSQYADLLDTDVSFTQTAQRITELPPSTDALKQEVTGWVSKMFRNGIKGLGYVYRDPVEEERHLPPEDLEGSMTVYQLAVCDLMLGILAKGLSLELPRDQQLLRRLAEATKHVPRNMAPLNEAVGAMFKRIEADESLQQAIGVLLARIGAYGNELEIAKVQLIISLLLKYGASPIAPNGEGMTTEKMMEPLMKIYPEQVHILDLITAFSLSDKDPTPWIDAHITRLKGVIVQLSRPLNRSGNGHGSGKKRK